MKQRVELDEKKRRRILRKNASSSTKQNVEFYETKAEFYKTRIEFDEKSVEF